MLDIIRNMTQLAYAQDEPDNRVSIALEARAMAVVSLLAITMFGIIHLDLSDELLKEKNDGRT